MLTLWFSITTAEDLGESRSSHIGKVLPLCLL
jgi:hypothetical protein